MVSLGKIVLSLSFGVCLLLIAAGDVTADANVSGSSGAAQAGVPIQVPGFRGLEPNLALVYNSGGGNGTVGVGWSLAGFSFVERQGKDGGSPQYDGTDSYNLGGEDLHPCSTSSSPGCVAGGNYFTEHENYQRIYYDLGLNEWTIVARDGTETRLTPVYVAAGGTYRWGISTVTDVRENQVNYAWWCDPGKNCFPDSVTYNGYRVKLYYATGRPDNISFADGSTLGETRQRLKSIKVEIVAGGSPIRAYKLSYPVTSNSTGRSLLGSVQMYGNNVNIDPSGNISGGTTLPAESYTYRTDASDHSFTGGGSWGDACTNTFGTGDFNRDGLQDVYCHVEWGSGALSVGISNGSSFTFSGGWGSYCGGTNDWLSTGDFDGDGRTDFLCRNNSTGSTNVGISSGSGLTWSSWSPNWCQLPSVTTFGDFNSDGKTDIACHSAGAPQPDINVRLSTGSAFGASTTWIANWCRPNGGTSWGESWGVSTKVLYPGDFNGDGYTDLLCRSTSGSPGGHWVALSNASTASFVHDGKWLTELWCGGNDQYLLGDFNGDGKTDYACYDNAGTGNTKETKVALSDGSKLQDKGKWLDAFTSQRFSVGDMNGDGRTDVWGHVSGTNDTKVGLSNGTTAFSDFSTWRPNWCTINRVVAGDFNGDGKTDISCHTSSSTSVALSGGIVGKTDVLTSLQNSSGGLTTLTYVPGTQWPLTPTSKQPPPAMLAQFHTSNSSYSANTSTHPLSPGSPTVISIAVSDGRGWSKTTTYQYSGGLYDPGEREWLGFETSTRTEPALPGETAGPWAKTKFKQHVASIGAVDEFEARDGAGKLLSFVDTDVETGGNGATEPYTAIVRWRRSENYDGTTTVRCLSPCPNVERFYQWFNYDDGNLIETRDYGNEDATGDEITTVGVYFPNTTEYVVDKIGRSATYAGIGIDEDKKLTEVQFFYDGEPSYTTPPQDGLLTNRKSWLNVGDRYISMCSSGICIQYDIYGNVTQTTDLKPAVTQISYDTTYHLFPETLTNGLNHVTHWQWDPICQAPTSVTDPNLQLTTTTYDPLCRHDRTDGPLGSFSDSSYVAIGTPASQYLQLEGPSPTGTGNHWARLYFDGLDRTYKRESRGATTGQDIQTREMTFNGRGGVSSVAAPRFTGASQYLTNYAYDVRDRRTVTTLPDGIPGETLVYGLRDVSSYDALNHRTTTSRTANGLTTYLDEYVGATPIRTTTARNLLGRTETTTDQAGNTWTRWLDSLGRITSVSDPDSGMESREYNDSGELIAVTNAMPVPNTERTEFTYDLVGRLSAKTTRVGTPSAQTTTFLYDEVRSGYYNKGRQTSMLDAAGYRYDDYDRLGRLARTQRSIDGQVYVSSSSYNAAGLPSSTTYPDSQVISWTYDAAGRLSTETGTISQSVYNAAGQLTSRTFTNGVVSISTYSPQRGRLETIQATKGGTTHQNLAYSYYDDGTILSVTSIKTMESWTYGYDDLHRLLTATNVDTPSLTQSFTYNEIGNITFNSQIGTYSYPTIPGSARPHAVLGAGSRTYQYNAIGQMINRNGTVIQWNGDEKPSLVGNVAFTYDGVGTRLKKVSGGQTTKWLGGDYEIAPDGTVTKYLVGGKRVGTSYFIHHRDHLGSIQVVTNSAGTEVRRQKHKPFGDQHFVSGSHLESKGWIGEREEETELVYLNARYYDPEIGRFVSPDPIAAAGQGLNRFSYSWNEPIYTLDPSGLMPPKDPTDVCPAEFPDCSPDGPEWWDLIWDAFWDEGYRWIPRRGRQKPCERYGFPCHTPPTPPNCSAYGPLPSVCTPQGGALFDPCSVNGPQLPTCLPAGVIRFKEREECPSCHFGNTYLRPDREGAFDELSAALIHGSTPIIGELQDAGVVLGAGHTMGERLVAGGSLLVNLGSGTLLPNFGRAYIVVARGQLHHAISRRIFQALERHPNLAGKYLSRDPRFVLQGADEAAHRGYQGWHRSLDNEIADWLDSNPQATPEQFEEFLRWRYDRPDLRHRFPTGLR